MEIPVSDIRRCLRCKKLYSVHHGPENIINPLVEHPEQDLNNYCSIECGVNSNKIPYNIALDYFKFESITAERSYYLGVIYSAGRLYNGSDDSYLRISADIEILKELRSSMNMDYPILPGSTKLPFIQISRYDIIDDLISIGFNPIMTSHNYPTIPTIYHSDFALGFLRGCTYYDTKRGRNYRIDTNQFYFMVNEMLGNIGELSICRGYPCLLIPYDAIPDPEVLKFVPSEL